MKPVDSSTYPALSARGRRNTRAQAHIVALPAIEDTEGYSVQSAIRRRRSIRSFLQRELTWVEISQLLWAAQGISDAAGELRAAPSAGALYPLELDVVIPSGVFRYRPQGHNLVPRSTEDIREAVSQAAHQQAWIEDAPCVLSFSAVTRRTAQKYRSRASRFVHLEAGHAAQNALLVATALGLGGTPVGAFDDTELAQALGLERTADPIYLVAIGWPRE